MRIKVYLHGYLKDFSDGPVEIEADNMAMAIEGVTRQLEGFKPNAVRGRHRITAVGYESVEDLFTEPKSDELHIFPQFAGGKKGGFMQILIGAALFAVSFFLPGSMAVLAGIAKSMGISMLLGGIAQLLAPQPSSEDAKKSRYLGSPKNTVAMGTRIPILYGTFRVYGHYLSFDIDAKDT